MNGEDLAPYFAGEKLYGDDFTAEQIAQWFEDEREGYADLGARNRASYRYGYHALNRLHGFRYLPPDLGGKALSLGGAYGDELIPIARRFDEIVIAEPSRALQVTDMQGVPVRYIEPRPDGRLPFADETFGVITCLGVLHHIPNVTAVVRELGRVLRRDGYALVREPVFSMGDWRQPRKDLTKRERGIPAHLLRSIFAGAGLGVVHEAPCEFRPVNRISTLIGRSVYGSAVLTLVDAALSRAFAWNQRYHTSSRFQKLQPAARYFVLRKLP
jgi:SAM-dependent methyltransferase